MAEIAKTSTTRFWLFVHFCHGKGWTVTIILYTYSKIVPQYNFRQFYGRFKLRSRPILLKGNSLIFICHNAVLLITTQVFISHHRDTTHSWVGCWSGAYWALSTKVSLWTLILIKQISGGVFIFMNDPERSEELINKILWCLIIGQPFYNLILINQPLNTRENPYWSAHYQCIPLMFSTGLQCKH